VEKVMRYQETDQKVDILFILLILLITATAVKNAIVPTSKTAVSSLAQQMAPVPFQPSALWPPQSALQAPSTFLMCS
jgi:hypothetical protein